MKVEIKIPAMGESITEATVGTILKPAGSSVKMDEEILELETDKVNQVLYAPESGVLNLSVATDDVVNIGDVIGHVDTEAAAPVKEEKPVEPPLPKKPKPKEEVVVEGGARITKEAYLEEIQKKEERKPAPPPTPPPPPAAPVEGRRETRRRMTRIRQVIARRLVEAQQQTAMVTTFNEIDMSVVMELRTKYKEKFQKEYGARLGFMSFFIKACESVLKEFPDINSYVDGDEIVHREYINIGIAVASERGLVVPVLRDCDQMSYAEIEKAIEEYAKKAREGGLLVDDLQGGGFTITNGGVFGSLLSTPILNLPQSGILAMHKIEKRAVVVNDEVVIRPMMYVALSYDHRIVDGKEAVTFLVHIKNMLEDPSRQLLEI